MSIGSSSAIEAFGRDYAAHRAQEGRGYRGADLLALPYLRTGPLAQQWSVRARTFDAFVKHVVRPMRRSTGRPLSIIDLGAGNGWLSHRLAGDGHHCTAIDIRDDEVDGLGIARHFPGHVLFETMVASFDAVTLDADSADVAVFNASLHYSLDLAATIAEAVRVVRPGGRIVILDSPFYASEADGLAMVAQKREAAHAQFGERKETLLAPPFIEFLTVERLALASSGMTWLRRRVTYPLWYEMRPLIARLNGRRVPSRFDLWTATVA